MVRRLAFLSRFGIGFAAAWALALASAAVLAQGHGRALESAVKATYLYKFAPFVDWPAEAFATRTSPLDICVAGDDPFGDLLYRAVQGQRVEQRPLRVRRVGDPADAPLCHILYVAPSPDRTAADILRSVKGMPVLTVTDETLAPDAKGIVHFVLRENRVRFEIDDAAAAAHGLAISSKLLSLATAVSPRSRRGP